MKLIIKLFKPEICVGKSKTVALCSSSKKLKTNKQALYLNIKMYIFNIICITDIITGVKKERKKEIFNQTSMTFPHIPTGYRPHAHTVLLMSQHNPHSF